MKKGFTLIELLAVIVILAIIALIATPLVINIINDSREESTKRSAELYMSAVEQGLVRKNMKESFFPTMCQVESDGNLLCGTEKVEVDVDRSFPTSGTIMFEDGKIVSYANLYINNRYVRKTQLSSDVILSKTPSKVLSNTCVAATATTVTTGNVPQGNYANGDEYICEVKDGVLYHFFVIGIDDSGDVNLIADRNMKEGGTPATTDELGASSWISVEDYNNDEYIKIDRECGADSNHTCYNAGPITALNQLDNVVSSWTNIPLKEYKTQEYAVLAHETLGEWRYITDIGWPVYNEIIRNTRGRLITVEEASNNGCMFEYDDETGKYYLGTCPLYMVNYTQFKDETATSDVKYNGKTKVNGVRGYWTSSIIPGYSTNGHCGIGIHDNAVLNCTYTSRSGYYGIRPVITLSASDFS